ncbi:MAG: hypothetical protein ACHQ4H_08475, partial [Ktedonobacterales bacterium]
VVPLSRSDNSARGIIVSSGKSDTAGTMLLMHCQHGQCAPATLPQTIVVYQPQVQALADGDLWATAGGYILRETSGAWQVVPQ